MDWSKAPVNKQVSFCAWLMIVTFTFIIEHLSALATLDYTKSQNNGQIFPLRYRAICKLTESLQCKNLLTRSIPVQLCRSLNRIRISWAGGKQRVQSSKRATGKEIGAHAEVVVQGLLELAVQRHGLTLQWNVSLKSQDLQQIEIWWTSASSAPDCPGTRLRSLLHPWRKRSTIQQRMWRVRISLTKMQRISLAKM